MYFQVQFPPANCKSSRPQSAQVVSVEGAFYHEQTVNDGLNEYSLEFMEVRKKGNFAIELKNGDKSITTLSPSFSICEL